MDAREQHIRTLEGELLRAQARQLQLEIELASCRATVDSVQLTRRMEDLVRRFEAAFGGTWTFDPKTNTVVPTDAVSKKEQRP